MPNHDPPQLFLIDGHALIYRAFFAMISRPLRTSRGENTSAAWGVVNFLLRLQTKYRPDYVIWVLDAGDSFRTAKYANYKSTRSKLTAELQQDFDLALEQVTGLLAAFRIPIVTLPGYEADDVIGTLARHYAGQGLQAVIVSGDKDFYQLIGPGIALLNPGRGGSAQVEEQWVDLTNASERLGVGPHQVVDYLAMVGDSSDNVPGVKGIGEKTAVQLLGQFGHLDAILENAATLTAKRPREALQAEAELARLSRDLVTLRTDVPITIDLEAAVLKDPDPAALNQLLAKLEFHSLIGRLGTSDVSTTADEPALPVLVPTEPPLAGALQIIDDVAALPALIRTLRQAPIVALAAKASSADARAASLVGLGFATDPDRAFYLPFAHRPRSGELSAPEGIRNLPPLQDPACRPLVELLQDTAVAKAGHNVKFDWEVLRGAGVELQSVTYDTMLASFVLDPSRRSHGLDTLSLDHLGRPWQNPAEQVIRGKAPTPYAELAVDEAARLTGVECATVIALYRYFAPRLVDTELLPLLDEIEMPLVEVLVDMEWTGIAIDRSVFDRLSRELTTDLVRLDAAIALAAGGTINLNSPKQLAAVLFERLGLPVLKKTRTGPSTDADVLEELAEMGHEVPRLLLEYRELQKLRSTYVDVLPSRVNPVTGRIHTSFNQTGAATGRLSSSDPNLQNIPVRTARGEAIRRGFVPGPGWKFVVADYSQIELRLMAHLSQDPMFIEAFEQGGDIHRQTAAIIFNVPVTGVTSDMRARAKTINFATIYGQGPAALSRQLGITLDEAKAFIGEYFRRFAGVRGYLDRQVQLARSQGYVETLFKRRRYIPEIKDKNFNTRAFGERLSQNSPLQGSAADLIKIAMARIHRGLEEDRLAGRLLLQVHDELVLEAPEGEAERTAALVKHHMESVTELAVPLVVDVGIGDNWLDAKK
jgi:DNA polymerase-1